MNQFNNWNHVTITEARLYVDMVPVRGNLCPVFYPTGYSYSVVLFYRFFSEEMKNMELAVLQNLLQSQWTSGIILLGHNWPFGIMDQWNYSVWITLDHLGSQWISGIVSGVTMNQLGLQLTSGITYYHQCFHFWHFSFIYARNDNDKRRVYSQFLASLIH